MAISEISGIAGTGRESMDGLMKDWYGTKWEDHVNTTAKCLALTGLGKVRGRMGGRRVLSAVIDSYPQSAGVAHFENASIVEPTSLTAFQPELISRSNYIRLRWTGEVEDMARAGDKAAFAGPRATELRLARKQYAVNKCRMAILGPQQVMGVSTSATTQDVSPLTVTMHVRNDRTSAAAHFHKFGTHYFKKGMVLDFSTTAAGNPSLNTTGLAKADFSSNAWEVTGVTSTTVEFTSSASGSIVDPHHQGTFLFPWGSRRTGAGSDDSSYDSYHAGYNGLNNLMLDDGIYGWVYGLERGATYTTLDGNRQVDGSAANRNFNDLLLILAIDNIVEEGSGEEPDTMYLNSAVRREVIQHLGMGNAPTYNQNAAGTEQQARRFAPVQTTSGYAKLAIVAGDRSMTYDTDRDCPPGMIYLLRKGTMGYLSNRTLSSVDKTPERYVADKDAHEIVMAERGNFFCTSPWTNGTLEDIDFDVSSITTYAA